MTIQRYRRHDKPGVRYVAWQVGGLFDSYPDWVGELVQTSRIKPTDTGFDVLTITGNWRGVSQGDWLVLEEKPDSHHWLWEMDTEAFTTNFYEVQ